MHHKGIHRQSQNSTIKNCGHAVRKLWLVWRECSTWHETPIVLLLLQIRTRLHLGCCLAAATAAASAMFMHLCMNSATPCTSRQHMRSCNEVNGSCANRRSRLTTAVAGHKKCRWASSSTGRWWPAGTQQRDVEITDRALRHNAMRDTSKRALRVHKSTREPTQLLGSQIEQEVRTFRARSKHKAGTD
jgi:hypothetical protein